MLPILLLAAALAGTPADTTRFAVLNHGRPAGGMTVVRAGDLLTVRYGHLDRGRGRWLETRYRLNSEGHVAGYESSALTRDGEPTGDVERLEVAGDSVIWTRGERRQAYPRTVKMLPWPSNRTPHDLARAARALLRDPGMTLVPGAQARAEVIGDTVVETQRGRERVRFVALHNPAFGPAGAGVWLDAADELFASEISWFITVRAGAEAALPALRGLELAWRARQTADLAMNLRQPVEPVLVIAGGDVFDSESGRVLPAHTVVVRDGRITEVGPASGVRLPAGARVIDATGRTVMPGMWEMHGHLLHTSQYAPAVLQLASGITTVRDLAADIDVGVSQRDRANAHDIVAPRLILGGFIEGPGAWAGPSEVLVRTEDDARAWVARYDSMGYRQVKLYNLVHPDLVPSIADEARRRGMILSGHIPRGLSIPAAVQLGFQEVNHAAFLFSNFFQDSLYVPYMRPYSAVAGAVAGSFDVDGPEMTRLIHFLRDSGTVIDGTFNLWMGGRALLNGEGDAVAKAYARLLKRLYEEGVALVPGTDDISSSSYVTELELYEHAGIPAPAVLRMATIVSARHMKEDADYGSIAPGRVADILVVDGRPAERIADLRKVEHVIRGGRVYRAAELRNAITPTQTAASSR